MFLKVSQQVFLFENLKSEFEYFCRKNRQIKVEYRM